MCKQILIKRKNVYVYIYTKTKYSILCEEE